MTERIQTPRSRERCNVMTLLTVMRKNPETVEDFQHSNIQQRKYIRYDAAPEDYADEELILVSEKENQVLTLLSTYDTKDIG